MPSYLNVDAELLKTERSYWTAREICQQPDVWTTVDADMQRQRTRISQWLRPRLADPRLRIVLSGAGSSAFVGQTLAPWLRDKLGRRIDAVSTTDLVGCPRQHFAEDVPTLLISSTRSGDSPESVATVDLANRELSHCHHLVLTCNREGALARAVAHEPNALCLRMPENTNDHSFAMTSSYTSMLVSCAAIFAPQPRQLASAVRAARFVIATLTERARALALANYDRLVVLGSGCLLATAREACLKSLELTNGKVMAMADSPLGIRHGPKAVIGGSTCIVLLRSADPYTARYDLDLLAEVCENARAAKIVVLSPDDRGGALRELHTNGRAEIVVPHDPADGPARIDDFWASLPYVVFCQILAFFKARALGVSADDPCPEGDINRVVRGVTIHAYRN